MEELAGELEYSKMEEVKLAENRGSCTNIPFEWAAQMLMILPKPRF